MPNLVRGVNELSAGFGAATMEGILRIHGLGGVGENGTACSPGRRGDTYPLSVLRVLFLP